MYNKEQVLDQTKDVYVGETEGVRFSSSHAAQQEKEFPSFKIKGTYLLINMLDPSKLMYYCGQTACIYICSSHRVMTSIMHKKLNVLGVQTKINAVMQKSYR